MKGPGLRIENDVRRTWHCPTCGAEIRAAGEVTSVRCGCRQEGVSMRLKEGRRQVRQFPRPPASPRLPEEDREAVAGTAAAVMTAEGVAPADVIALATVLEDPTPAMQSEPDTFEGVAAIEESPAASDTEGDFGAGLDSEAPPVSTLERSTPSPAG